MSKTIELSDSQTRTWHGKGALAKATRAVIREREQQRANILGIEVEVFDARGKSLFRVKPHNHVKETN